MSAHFSFCMLIILISLLGIKAPIPNPHLSCSRSLRIHCKDYKEDRDYTGPYALCTTTADPKGDKQCRELELDLTEYNEDYAALICRTSESDINFLSHIIGRRCSGKPEHMFSISTVNWLKYLKMMHMEMKPEEEVPPPDCNDALLIECEDERDIGPVISCTTNDVRACKDIYGLRKVNPLKGYPGYVVCRLSDPQEGLLSDMISVQEECVNPAAYFEIPSDVWIDYVQGIEAKRKIRQEQEKEEALKKKEKTWTKKEKRAKAYGKKVKESRPTIKKWKEIHSLRWYQKYYKSVQGSFGDCVMHSINIILGNAYFTNYVMGHIFGDELTALKAEKAKLEETELKAIEEGEDFDFIAVYDNEEKTGTPIYYEAFGGAVVENALKIVNAEETKLTVAGGEQFDFSKHKPDQLALVLSRLRQNPEIQLLGLRFSYKSSLNVGHSIGIQFRDRWGDIKTRHWLFVNSWESADPLKFTDSELANYLYEGFVHHKKYRWVKTLRVVTVIDEPGAELLPPPPQHIFANDKLLDMYYICFQQHLEGRIEEQSYWMDKCTNDVDEYMAEKREKAAKAAMTDYENYFENDYDDDMYISYNDDDELEAMIEINRLKQLRDREQYQVNGLFRQYYSRKNAFDADDSIQDSYY